MHDPEKLKSLFQKGKIFAYPTEAVFGLGCDPLNENAVQRLLDLKSRPVEKGLILVADSFGRASSYIDESQLEPSIKKEVLDSWPGFVTWLVPKSKSVPDWICGNSELVALRVSAHPVVSGLCKSLDSVLVSTSANISGQDAIKNRSELYKVFGDQVEYIDGELGGEEKPSQIRHALTGKIIRGN
ncbi:Sua5/YciO/YrdC/YwlC family protein [Alteromonas sp. a30]|uniref:Sua5/YciO/YrdC/YwlC family protein n=1 Tax=Alteromonas sp. a30 TaxID=2730917 RepID=UPI002280DE45|nr:Sua5/YciO/YrdC/YwlC family protein [Alteromonas sp. a30]